MANYNNLNTSISDYSKQIGTLKEEQAGYEDQLTSSPSAYGGEGKPTSQDISTQTALNRVKGQIQSLSDEQKRLQWYGPKPDKSATPISEDTTKQGLMSKGLDLLTRPLYGIVGATKHAIGQGTGSLHQDIADNMVRNKNTFSDVLRTSGVTGGVAAPLGFTLDVMMDPVNWFTAGTSALIPKLGMGIYKGVKTGDGVMKGFNTAARAGLTEKAVSATKYIPYFRKSETFNKIANSAYKATDDWEKFSGIDAAKIVSQKGFGIGEHRVDMGKLINTAADMIPGARPIVDSLWYDPKRWVRNTIVIDKMKKALGASTDLKGAVNAAVKGQSVEPFLHAQQEARKAVLEGVEPLSATPGAKPFSFDFKDSSIGSYTTSDASRAAAKLAEVDRETLDQAQDIADKITMSVDDATTVANDKSGIFHGADAVEQALKLANEEVGGIGLSLKQVKTIVDSGALDKTGVVWYDNIMDGVRKWEKRVGSDSANIVIKGAAILDKYAQGMAIFKAAKVGASPVGHVNAVVGNIAMAHLFNGGLSPSFFRTLEMTWGVYMNKPGYALKLEKRITDLGGDVEKFRRDIKGMKTAAKSTFGSMDILDINKSVDELLNLAKKDGSVDPNIDREQVIAEVKNIMSKLEAENPKAFAAINAAKDRATETKTGLYEAKKAVTEGEDFVGTGMLSSEMMTSKPVVDMFEKIAKNAEMPGIEGAGWKVWDLMMNKMPGRYEKIDQAFKLTTYIESMTTGYTLPQLRQMTSYLDISNEEIKLGKYLANGQTLYRMSPETSMEIANLMYLNYAAMPSAVRVLRNIPILGSPFVSFMYGMTIKTGQTLVYNPAAFNKVTFAMNDFGGAKTPLEKKTLDTPFYSYLKQPGMYRIPFFDENPMYLNLANMIPYYSLNMFNPAKTSYADDWRGRIAGGVQESPFMKDPVGNVIFENIILPLILGEDTRPQSQFGTPLYPYNATPLDKFGYASRNLGEAFVPNVAAYAGILTPEAIAQYVPSYRWRKLSEAKAGNNQLGISGKEPWMNRTVRELLNLSGVPLQTPVNTTFNQGTE